MKNAFRIVGLAAAMLLLAITASSVGSGRATATHTPANKVIADGNTLEVMRTAGDGVVVEEILRGTLKTSDKADLALAVTLECALWTTTATKDSGSSETSAQVKVWVEIDGNPVSVDGDLDDGKVVFCNRAQRMETQFINPDNDDDIFIKSYLRSRTANGFNWLALNLNRGLHEIVVYAELDSRVVESDSDQPAANHPEVSSPAAAAIGKRTLIVEPAKMANDATL